MDPRRKTFQTKFLKHLKDLKLHERNLTLYEAQFDSMTDDEFSTMVDSIVNDEFVLPAFSFNMADKKIDLDTIMRKGEELGIKWFEKLRLTDVITGDEYTTVPEYLILQLEIRRQVQHLVKKRSTAPDNRSVDQLTGQVTGKSKGASITLPELTVLNAKGLQDPIIEMIKVNGGDSEARNDMLRQLSETGDFSLGPIENLNSRPKVLDTTNAYLKGMMLSSTL